MGNVTNNILDSVGNDHAMRIQKRDGRIVEFDRNKIADAIDKAFVSVGEKQNRVVIETLTSSAIEVLNDRFRSLPTVEQIQDIVEEVLMNEGFNACAKSYILYRAERNRQRDLKDRLMRTYTEIYKNDVKGNDLLRDNANIDCQTPMGIMLKYGAEGTKHFNLEFVIKPEHAAAHRKGLIHIHDLDFLTLTTTCVDPSTKIIIRTDKKVKVVRADFFDHLLDGDGIPYYFKDDIEIFGNGEWTKLINVVKHPIKDKTMVAFNGEGINLKVTSDHRIPVINQFQDYAEIEAGIIQQGDRFKICDVPTDCEYAVTELDLIEEFANYPNIAACAVVDSGVMKTIKERMTLSEFFSAIQQGCSLNSKSAEYKAIHCKYSGQTRLSVSDLLRLEEILGKFDHYSLQLSTAKSSKKRKVKAVLPLNYDLGYIVGLMLSGGSISEFDSARGLNDFNSSFSNSDDGLIHKFKQTMKQVFPSVGVSNILREPEFGYVNINSGIFNLLFNGILTSKHGSREMDLPGYVFSAPDDYIGGIVAGLIDGNEDVSVGKDNVQLTLVSHNLAGTLSLLMNLRGIPTSITNGANIDSCRLIINHNLGRLRTLVKSLIVSKVIDTGIKMDIGSFSNKVICTERPEYVYDFETENHYFSANGVTVHNCCQIDIVKLFNQGFSTGHGSIREPNAIATYAALACIAIQSNQNDQHGGQSIPNFDYGMALGVAKTFRKNFIINLDRYLDANDSVGLTNTELERLESPPIRDLIRLGNDSNSLVTAVSEALNRPGMTKACEYACRHAYLETDKMTFQAMESVVHNLCSMHSRAGAQVPFSSINYGTDTSHEGRMAIKNILLALEKGLGHGETPIFPIHIFRVMEGVNYNPTDPNYDLFQLAMRASAKRLFPTFSFQDAPFNKALYDPTRPETLVSYMGCVDSKEVIVYKDSGCLYVEPFEVTYACLSELIVPQRWGESEYIDTSQCDILIRDTRTNGWSKVLKFIKNPNRNNWKRVRCDNGRSLLVTEDHPFFTKDSGIKKASELQIGDEIQAVWDSGFIDEFLTEFIDPDEAWMIGFLFPGSNGDSEWLIPNEVFGWQRDARLAFIAGMMDVGRLCNFSKNCESENIHGSFTGLANKGMAIQLMYLLQSCGIPARQYLNRCEEYEIEFICNADLIAHMALPKVKPACEIKDSVRANWSPDFVKVTAVENCANNSPSYDVETTTGSFDVSGLVSHNCRTRVMANVYNPSQQVANGRGNLSFTSINLPRLAIEAKGSVDAFFSGLDKTVALVLDQLMERFAIQAKKRVKNFPFLMGQGIWLGSEYLDKEDMLEEVLKNGTLSVGFIGLAEALILLTGKHHGECTESQALGLRIVQFMRDKCDEKSQELKMNFTLLATPAEGLSGRFTAIDRKLYGCIPGVTDKDYYTNSFHVPVTYNTTIFNKIHVEAPYHALTNAGHITYIELDGDTVKNLPAFERIIRCMKEEGIGYGAVNHPVDRDPVCGYSGVINDECPQCGRTEDDDGGVLFERLRRITGYLVGSLERFNNAKRAEERDRVKHKFPN